MYLKRRGWNWVAFLFGPFWYLFKGMKAKGVWMIVLTVSSIFLLGPFIWIYCGTKGSRDLYVCELNKKSNVDLSSI